MSYESGKCDALLGQRVADHLQSVGVQTPMIKNDLSVDDKIMVIADKMKDVLTTLGLDLSDDSLCDTPARVAKMFVKELYWGLDTDKFPKATTVENKMGYDEMVIECNIGVMSDCEHHLRTIVGKAHVAYIPKNKVLGLSKLNRIVNYFARRPQIQERLAEQIYHALELILETKDVAVVIEAEHYCVKQRGIQDHDSYTITSKLGGCFREDPAVRSEFMSLTRK